MSSLVKLLYDVGALGRRYNRVHESVCGLSPRSIMRSWRRADAEDRAARVDELGRILSQLQEARTELMALDEEAVSVRRGREIHRTLLDYIGALSLAGSRLEALCREGGDEPGRSPTRAGDQSNRLKIAYDDAVQNHRRLAELLNELVATL
jgi:hypothetical protein